MYPSTPNRLLGGRFELVAQRRTERITRCLCSRLTALERRLHVTHRVHGLPRYVKFEKLRHGFPDPCIVELSLLAYWDRERGPKAISELPGFFRESESANDRPGVCARHLHTHSAMAILK
jgi:hypothetical protein